MNREAFEVLMYLADLPGGWAVVVQYDLTEQHREAQAAAQLQPLRKRCEVVGGFDDWRLHADFVLAVGSDEWILRGGYLARRPPELCRRDFRNWLNSKPLPDAVLLRAEECRRLLSRPAAAWGSAWEDLRRGGTEG